MSLQGHIDMLQLTLKNIFSTRTMFCSSQEVDQQNSPSIGNSRTHSSGKFCCHSTIGEVCIAPYWNLNIFIIFLISLNTVYRRSVFTCGTLETQRTSWSRPENHRFHTPFSFSWEISVFPENVHYYSVKDLPCC